MKEIILFGFFTLSLCHLTSGQNTEFKLIKLAIEQFAQAGDQNDAVQLAQLLDDNYRIVMNQLFGSEQVDIMTRTVYLEKIKSGEFGGDKRKVVFGDILVNGITASALVTFQGEKSTFISLLIMVKDKKGLWKIISDVPMIS